MKKVLFVCLGNICRSTMAEFLFKKIIDDRGLSQEFVIESRGTHAMTGSKVHHGTAKVLDRLNIDYYSKRSTQLTKADGNDFDYIIGMDKRNIQDIKKIIDAKNEGKVHSLMSYTGIHREIADPWYTGNFNATFTDISEGLEAFLKNIL